MNLPIAVQVDIVSTKAGTKVGAIFERAAKHAFTNTWLNGMTGGDIKHGFITGMFSSMGNDFISNNLTGEIPKVACAAALGGTIEEIGGGKFANGAITGAYGMIFNDLMHDLQAKIAEYQLNKENILANSFVMDALLETSEPGAILTHVRNYITETYGDQKSKEANAVFNISVKIARNIKKSVGNAKMSDTYIYKTVALLAAETLYLQAKGSYIAYQIKQLDLNTYYEMFEPWNIEVQPLRFGGGGGGKSW